MILSSKKPIKYLEPWPLCLNLSDTTIWSMSTKFKEIVF